MKQLYMHTASEMFTNAEIKALEKKFQAKYMLETSLLDSEGCATFQVYAIFWQPTLPDPNYSHYVAVRRSFDSNRHIMIASGKCVETMVFSCIVNECGEVVYSRHRHDCRGFTLGDDSVCIDGGRDYTRLTSLANVQSFTLKDDQIDMSSGEVVKQI